MFVHQNNKLWLIVGQIFQILKKCKPSFKYNSDRLTDYPVKRSFLSTGVGTTIYTQNFDEV